jgi:lipopolysaccharide/colanic/teichoic acid biosynthesis glycosyltransferase
VYRVFFKRLIDFILALLALILLSPFFIIIFLLLLVVNKGNPLFIQQRPGQHEVPFNLFKFKTMTDAVDSFGELLPDEDRVTKVGELVRKTSLDEIPQLINVIKGDMSLVGPRPLLMKYLPYYTDKESARHSVRPGITGLAQVKGRNMLSWDKKLALDAYYSRHLSLRLDLIILWQTALKVLSRKDVVVNPHLVFPPLDIERQHLTTDI